MVHRPKILSRTAHAVVTLLFVANLVVGAQKNDSIASPARGGRLSTLGGTCFDSTVSDEAVLRDLRGQHVKFNLKKSMYRDGDIIAVYKLNRPGHGSLAGCADACLLNWRLTNDMSQALDTDCSLDENSHCPMTSGILVADRKCQAFMFNRITSVCTLLSAERSLKLTGSSNFWSGKLMCEDMNNIHDWAESIVSRVSPPPPPPADANILLGWPLYNTIGGGQQDSDTRSMKSLGADIEGDFPLNTKGIIYEKGGTGYGTVIYMVNGTLYLQSGAGGVQGGTVELSYTPTSTISTIKFAIDFTNQTHILAVNGAVVHTNTTSTNDKWACGTNTGGTSDEYGGSTAVRRDTQKALLNGNVTSCNLYSYG